MTSTSGVVQIISTSTVSGVIDVVGVPSDAAISATGATPAPGMIARDSSTLLVYARDSAGVWSNILPLTDADHGQLVGLTDEDHPQYRAFLAVATGSAVPTAAAGLMSYLTNRNQPVYSDGTSWMGLTDGSDRFSLTGTGLYYGPPINTSSGTAIAGTGIQRCAPFFVPKRTTFTKIVAHSGAAAVASSVIRPAVWADDGTGHPGARVVDGGVDLSANSTDTDLVQTITFTLDPGLYWVGGIMNGGPNLRTVDPTRSPFATLMGGDTFTNFAFAGYSRTPGAGAPTDPFGTPGTTSTVPAVRLGV